MRIIIAVSGSHGDVRPMIALGKYLKSYGHSVLICAAPEDEEFVLKHGLEFKAVGKHCSYMFDKLLEEKSKLKWGGIMAEYLREEVSLQFDQLPDAVIGADMILGAGLQFASRSFAEHLNVPYRHILHMPQALRSSSYPPAGMLPQNNPGFINNLLWMINGRYYNNILIDHINRYRTELKLKSVTSVYDYLTSKIIIASDKPLAKIPSDVKSEYIQTGYFNLTEEGELDKALTDFIESGSPPIYVGFGSMPNFSGKEITGILMEVTNSLGTRMIISKGWANLGGDFDLKNVHIIGHVPHAKLFPKMAAVVHHGGSGTTHTAARAGVPQIIIPHAVDQFFWGEQIFRLKLGPKPVSIFKLTSRKLIDRISKVYSTSEFKLNAVNIAKELSKTDGIKDTYNYITNPKMLYS